MEMALGNKKDREDEDDDKDSCNRRLQNKSFGATALWMRLVMLNIIMLAFWYRCGSRQLLAYHYHYHGHGVVVTLMVGDCYC